MLEWKGLAMSQTADRSQRTTADTPDKILSCDHCKSFIDPLEEGMVFWDPRDENAGVPYVAVAHKRCHNARKPDDYSCELYWLADPAQALRRLSSMADSYRFTGAQLQRVIDVAWAVSHVATEDQKRKVVEMYDKFGTF